MDYCLNLNSSTKLKQSTRTTKQNRHFYFNNPTALSFKNALNFQCLWLIGI